MNVSTVLSCWNLQTYETKDARIPFEILMPVPINLAPNDTVRRPHLLTLLTSILTLWIETFLIAHQISEENTTREYLGKVFSSIIYSYTRCFVHWKPASQVSQLKKLDISSPWSFLLNSTWNSYLGIIKQIFWFRRAPRIHSIPTISAHHSALALANAFMNAGTSMMISLDRI